MTLSTFLIRLILLGLPGIIGSRIYGELRASPERKDWQDILEIVLFALGSYGVLAVILKVAHYYNHLMMMGPPLQALFQDTLEISWLEVGIASAVGVVLPFLAAYVNKFKLINKLGRSIRASNRFGDEDVWDFFHNMKKPDWIFVRDYRTKLVYYGWIQVYSESERERELVLRDVRVFSNTSDTPGQPSSLLYEAEVIYLSRESDELSIEVPFLPAPKPTQQDDAPIIAAV